MKGDRARVAAALFSVAGLILGIVVTVVLQGEQPAQSGDRRRVIRPEKAPNTGLPFSPGILVGNTLYVSGHLGRDPVTSQLVRGGIEVETRQALANVREVLRTAGMDFKDVATFNAVYRESFPADPPARATVQVAALNAGARVELQMVAIRR